MRVTIRAWAGIAVVVACVVALSSAVGSYALAPSYNDNLLGDPGYGAPAAEPLTSGLPLFPNNLTHFVYIVRENEVFDAYLGDCATTINSTCNDGTDYTSQTNHIADVPFLHYWAQHGTVFDNMYSGVDPYSAQAHSFLLSDNAKTAGGSDTCGSTTVEGTGTGTQWGDYNSSNMDVVGKCGWSPDSGQEYPPGGTILDRDTGPNVAQSGAAPPFLLIGDWTWELEDAADCSVPSTSGIPGSLPGNSEALEHVDCTGTDGWWTNTTSGSVNDLPPVTNPSSHIPQILFGCQYNCNNNGNCGGCTNVAVLPDQYAAYSFISYVKDYGLPTTTYIELFDDHPGPSCTSSSWDTCIQWNDQSMNLIVSDIFNGSSPYRNNTVVAITEDDTEAGSNGPDHINDARRFPFVLVAPPNVMKTGPADGADCGITTGPCGNVVHQTFNTSNVLAVEERVELNVNQNIFSTTAGALATYPMAVNDQLAETDPLEPVWKCHDPSVPCNTGTISSTPVLTSTSISPNPVSTTPSGTVSLSATALDQTGASMSGAAFAWTVYPTSLGTFSSSTVQSPTFTAGSSNGAGHICENATAGTPSVTLMACVIATVSSTGPTLTTVTLTPWPSTSTTAGGAVNFHSIATLSNSANVYPPSATFTWNLGTGSASLGSLNATTGTNVAFTAGTTTGTTAIVCLNVTYGSPSVTKGICSAVTIAKAAAVLTSGTLTPLSVTVSPGGTQSFYSQGLDQYGNPLSVGTNYAWSLTPTSLGSLSTTSGPINITALTAGSTLESGTLTVQITNGPAKPVFLNATITVSSSSPLVASFTQTPWHGTGPLTVTVSGTVSGGSGAGYAQTMSWGDGSTPTAGSGATIDMSHTYAATTSSYTPSLTVTDSAGHTFQLSLGAISVYNNGTSSPLTAYASCTPLTGVVPLTVPCTGSASGGTQPYTYVWTFGDGGTGTGSQVSHTYAAAGTYTGSLTVTDAKGTSAGFGFEVDVTPASTSGGLSISVYGPSNGTAPLLVSFTATAEGGTAPYTYSWDWGDGTASSTGDPGTHTYTAAGTYTVTVTATDSASPSHQITSPPIQVIVSNPPSSVQSNSGLGPFGIPWTEWGLLIVVLALVAVLAVVLLSRRPPKPHYEDEAAAYPTATTPPEPSASPGYAGGSVAPGPPPAAARSPSGYGPADDSRAPDPMGRR